MECDSFEELFKIKSKTEFAEKPSILAGVMMDMGFQKLYVVMTRLASSACPDTFSSLLKGSIGPSQAADEISAVTGLDREKLESMFAKMGCIEIQETVLSAVIEKSTMKEWCENNSDSELAHLFFEKKNDGWRTPSSDQDAKQ